MIYYFQIHSKPKYHLYLSNTSANNKKKKTKLTFISSSSRKLYILCCLTSALFFRDDVNVCGVQPVIYIVSFASFSSCD